MLSLRRILILTCTFSLMLASPTQTHPTGNTAAAPNAPNTLLGRQYQLTKRAPNPNPLIFMDPALDSALTSAKTSENARKTTPQPQPQRPTSQRPASHAPVGSSETSESATPASASAYAPEPAPAGAKNETNAGADTKTATSTANNVARRRLVPYPRYLAERSAARALDGGRANGVNYASGGAHSRLPYAGEDPPTAPSPPKVTNTFLANRTKDNLDSYDASHRASGRTGQKSSGKSSAASPLNLLGGLGGLGGL